MTKAYLAGFIAGTQGKGWDDNPFIENNFGICAMEWRDGCADGTQVAQGDSDIGIQQVIV